MSIKRLLEAAKLMDKDGDDIMEPISIEESKEDEILEECLDEDLSCSKDCETGNSLNYYDTSYLAQVTELDHAYTQSYSTSNIYANRYKRKVFGAKNKDSQTKKLRVSSSHNELEKNRRAHLRYCLDKLQDIVPVNFNLQRNTTLALLNATRCHILNLIQTEKSQLSIKKKLLYQQCIMNRRINFLLKVYERQNISKTVDGVNIKLIKQSMEQGTFSNSSEEAEKDIVEKSSIEPKSLLKLNFIQYDRNRAISCSTSTDVEGFKVEKESDESSRNVEDASKRVELNKGSNFFKGIKARKVSECSSHDSTLSNTSFNCDGVRYGGSGAANESDKNFFLDSIKSDSPTSSNSEDCTFDYNESKDCTKVQPDFSAIEAS